MVTSFLSYPWVGVRMHALVRASEWRHHSTRGVWRVGWGWAVRDV